MAMRVGCYFAGGNAFWVGVAMLVAAGLLTCLRSAAMSSSTATDARPALETLKWLPRWLLVLGLVQLVLSATPLPWWLWGLMAAVSAGVLCSESRLEGALAAARLRGRHRTWGLGLIVCGVLAGVVERFAYPQIAGPPSPVSMLCVIGDSLSAGLYEGENEPTWPRQFSMRYEVRVVDASRQGATTHSALKQAQDLPEGASVVLIEIGGNDMLEGVPAAEFHQALAKLLRELKRADRTLVMCELPRPPFRDGYGRAQRALSAEFGVLLIPRWELTRILVQNDTTEDGLHLSPLGHELLADVVWKYAGKWLK